MVPLELDSLYFDDFHTSHGVFRTSCTMYVRCTEIRARHPGYEVHNHNVKKNPGTRGKKLNAEDQDISHSEKSKEK